MVLSDICLHVACEVIFDNQDIFHHWLFLNAYCHLHAHIVNMHQVEWLGADDQPHGQELWFHFEDMALGTVTDIHHHSVGHVGPPESLP